MNFLFLPNLLPVSINDINLLGEIPRFKSQHHLTLPFLSLNMSVPNYLVQSPIIFDICPLHSSLIMKTLV